MQRMKGLRSVDDIIKEFGLKTPNKLPPAPYEWNKRMGVHMAFHQDFMNNLIHCVFTTFDAWCVVVAFSLFNIPLINLNAGIPLLLTAFYIYSRVDVGAALALIALFLPALPLTFYLHSLFGSSTLAVFALSIVLFFGFLAFQVQVGHGVFEKGIDDADVNFAEFFKTYKPVYLALLPIYSALDLMFFCGLQTRTCKIH
eukprot:TRINITY_DN4779_c0_g1_i1.p1 TRINITY_DN4779_c0_g1~~TRINITY_DN4779_c0_g1_i1.p1  ORF type:complete len:199 (-),score=22.91 TRINITY_DN4779_c0_g1_i1:156-752(-)